MEGSQHSSLKKTYNQHSWLDFGCKKIKKVIIIGGKPKKCYHAIATDALKCEHAASGTLSLKSLTKCTVQTEQPI